MGACYTVEMKIKYKDKTSLINKINDYINRNNPKKVTFNLEGINRRSIEDLMHVFFTNKAEIHTPESESLPETDGVFEVVADFDAKYSWEIVMIEMFRNIAGVIKNGSQIYIEPDNHHYTYTVQDGVLI